MKSHCLALLLALLAFGWLAQSAAADPPRLTNLRPDILYTHRGEFIQVGPMHPLTMNAHVQQFAYDPLGLEIAVVGSEIQGDQTVHFVKTVDVKTGRELSRLAVAATVDDESSGFQLIGWTPSGQYVMLERHMYDDQDPPTLHEDYLRWDLSAYPPATQLIYSKVPLPPDALTNGEFDNRFASPDAHWFLLRQDYHFLNAEGKPDKSQSLYLLYDVEKNTFRVLNVPPGTNLSAWADNNHLTFRQDKLRKQFDVITGQISPIPDSSDAAAPIASKQYPDLTLDVEHRVLVDTTERQGQLKSYIIWIRRTAFGKIPLGAASAGLMPDNYDSSPRAGNNDPQAIWSPIGKQVAFIANNDLYVTDLTAATDLLPAEKMAVGLKLSCAEEQALAVSDLKQIGLGLIQYIQDDDEKYPTADGFIDKIYPYIKSMDVFQIGSRHFVYEQPADLELAKMDSPADTENGYMDLPCARVVLFADGHVKVFPK